MGNIGQGLEARIDRLERQNRLLKGAGGIAFALCVGMFLTAGNPPPGPVEGTSFTLKDGNGVKRGEWYVHADGTAYFRMLDDSGKATNLQLTALKEAGDGEVMAGAGNNWIRLEATEKMVNLEYKGGGKAGVLIK